MIKKLGLIAAFLLLPFTVNAQTSPLDGTWEIYQAVGAPGIFTEDAYQEAERAVGQNLTIAGKNVILYNGLNCIITGAQSKLVSDFDFGSSGGSWREIGLEPLPDQNRSYKVVEVAMNCPETTDGQQSNRTILVANDGSLIMLNFWETWAVIRKAANE